MGVEEPPKSVEHHLIQAAEPAGIDEGLHLSHETDGNFRLESRGFWFRSHGRLS
jgi:hypothetical protein